MLLKFLNTHFLLTSVYIFKNLKSDDSCKVPIYEKSKLLKYFCINYRLNSFTALRSNYFLEDIFPSYMFF